MLDGLAKLIAVAVFGAGVVGFVLTLVLAVLVEAWTPMFTVFTLGSIVAAFLGWAMLSVLK